MIRVFIQARMSSSRFPGKVLAPLKGKPVIKHLLDRVMQEIDPAQVVVLTSTKSSDDPLVSYLESENCSVFRGDLQNTLLRFQQALDKFPCESFIRLCADSPLFDARLIPLAKLTLSQSHKADLVTNVFPRTFPKGQSIELVNTETFLKLNTSSLSENECEHVTTHFYNHADRFTIINIEKDTSMILPELHSVVDTLSDLHAIEARLS